MKKGGISSGSSSYSYREPLHETAIFHYLAILLITISLIISVIALVNINKLKNALVPQEIDISDFLNKLTSHDEAKAYAGVSPLNIVEVNRNNIANLQAQIAGLDASYIGNFIVQYADKILVYDYSKDKIKGAVSLQQQPKLPADFFAKLNMHPELKGMESEQPAGGQLDAATLSVLQQQLPSVYAGAKAGDFLLRYQSRLIIYDYNADRIVNAVALQ